MSKKQTAIRLDDDMKAAATIRAESLERTFGSYIRHLIAEDLQCANPLRSGAESLGELAQEISSKLKKHAQDHKGNPVNSVKKRTKHPAK